MAPHTMNGWKCTISFYKKRMHECDRRQAGCLEPVCKSHTVKTAQAGGLQTVCCWEAPSASTVEVVYCVPDCSWARWHEWTNYHPNQSWSTASSGYPQKEKAKLLVWMWQSHNAMSKENKTTTGIIKLLNNRSNIRSLAYAAFAPLPSCR